MTRKTITVTTQSERADKLCPSCNNPSLWFVRLFALLDDGPARIGWIQICDDCDIDDIDEGDDQ